MRWCQEEKSKRVEVEGDGFVERKDLSHLGRSSEMFLTCAVSAIESTNSEVWIYDVAREATELLLLT